MKLTSKEFQALVALIKAFAFVEIRKVKKGLRIKVSGLVIILLLFVTSCASAPWSKGDIAREVAWQGIHLIDWSQTLEIADNPSHYYETNPLMGKHPSRDMVNLYMGTSALLHPLITNALPSSCRPWWQWITISVSSTLVINNYSIGLHGRF